MHYSSTAKCMCYICVMTCICLHIHALSQSSNLSEAIPAQSLHLLKYLHICIMAVNRAACAQTHVHYGMHRFAHVFTFVHRSMHKFAQICTCMQCSIPELTYLHNLNTYYAHTMPILCPHYAQKIIGFVGPVQNRTSL